LLFVPEFTQQVDPRSAKRNVDFMARYPQFQMYERDPLSNRPPPAELVHSGDLLAIIRLDGLDPMLAWGMGSSTGHVTTPLWIDGELFVTESTVVDSYWPTGGIQKTPYNLWLHQAEQAGYNVVWAPLNAKARHNFNETAAVEFFLAHEGLEYGYRNMLYGWIDTAYNNYPCFPGDYSSVCVQWEFFETSFALLERLIPELVTTFVGQAFNLRLGTTGLKVPELYKVAAGMGLETRDIPAIPEQDSWDYVTTKNGEPAVGRSMVCCVYVCSAWKAGGLFGDNDINCGELTNADDYSLNILESEYKQILGRYTLDLNGYARQAPYDHMSEKCESLAPDYIQTPGC